MLLQFKTYKIVYRRYAGLFFSVGIDVSDNELTALEAIHLFVEILDHYFSNVCELDLVFNFHKVPVGYAFVCVLKAVCREAWLLQTGESLGGCGSAPSASLRRGPAESNGICVARSAYVCVQVYLILDEFILGGEFEETSKKVRRWERRTTRRCAARISISQSVRPGCPDSCCTVLDVQVILERLKELDSIEI